MPPSKSGTDASEAGDPNRLLNQAIRGAEPQTDDFPSESGSAAALIFDAEAKLIYVSAAFAKLTGVDPLSLIGSVHPLPWCRGNGHSACRDRIRHLAGREARALGIESVSWSLSRHCGKCLRAGFGREKTERAFQNELRGAICFAVSDCEMMERILAMLPPYDGKQRRALETALRRIALEVERLGLSVTLPVRPQGVAYEDLRLLSPRELEVLRPFMEGRRVTSIARLLCISPHTVRNHLQSIYRKLAVRSQAELIEKLRREIPVPHLPEMPRSNASSD